MLDCQIATAADLSLLRMSVSRPKENIVKYNVCIIGPLTTPFVLFFAP